jgi:hypothetical protein
MIQPAKPLGGDDLVMRLMYELHAHLPEDQRPLSMSDLSDEQAARARRAVHAVLTEWESAKADLAAMTTTPTDDEALVERLRRVERQFASGNGSYEAPNGIIHFRVDCRDLFAVLKLAALTAAQPVEGGWQPIESAPKDGTWILLRGRSAAGAPMIPAVCAWRDGAWRDSASLRDMSSLIVDVPPGHSADWQRSPP